MHVFRERTGILGPVYRPVGKGFSDADLAKRINPTEARAEGCVSWMLHLLDFNRRRQLEIHADATSQRLLRRNACPDTM
jgi:hypothetical protein